DNSLASRIISQDTKNGVDVVVKIIQMYGCGGDIL
ncbi:MAG: hypothetical protein XD80_1109, partial [Synergistales bacterium 53_16]